MERSLFKIIKKDLGKKIILLTGPRQCGKTTLSKMLATSLDYLNYDDVDDRLAIHKKKWDRTKELLVLDELHKMPKWKQWLKGVYDTEGLKPAILVTGSAKLDTYKKVGDSLAGRFFQFRMHPLDIKEILQFNKKENPEKILDCLLQVGGFPEPFLENNQDYYQRWKKTHQDIIIKQDLIELEHVQQIVQIETLVHLLKKRVGSPVSYSSLCQDLQVSDKTVKNWITILENMYLVFRIYPHHKNIARSLLKQPKIYFYDTGQVEGDKGFKLENMVACALLKEMQFQSDAFGKNFRLHYLRNKLKQEVDFLVTKNDEPYKMIEVKWADENPASGLEIFSRQMPVNIQKIQVVKELKKNTSYPNGIRIERASSWLADLVL